MKAMSCSVIMQHVLGGWLLGYILDFQDLQFDVLISPSSLTGGSVFTQETGTKSSNLPLSRACGKLLGVLTLTTLLWCFEWSEQMTSI